MRGTVSGVAIGRLWTDLLIAIEIGVRDPIAPVDVMLGQAAALNRTHMKRIDERRLPIEKRITGKVARPTPYSHLPVEGTAGIVTLIGLIAVGAMTLSVTMTVKGETEKMSARSCIGAEVTPEEALMSYLGEMRNQADDDELTVMLKVSEVPGYQRLVTHSFLKLAMEMCIPVVGTYHESNHSNPITY
jgi:hypothetical protein